VGWWVAIDNEEEVMPEERKISFTTEKSMRYHSEFDVVNCEKVHLADVDGDGRPEIVIPRCGSSGDRLMGEIAVYDLDLNLKASDSWDGTAMDVTVADVDGDGVEEIIVAGGMRNSIPIIRVYRYNENYRGNLELSSQTSYGSPDGLFSAAKAIHVADMDDDGQVETAVLTIVEGRGENTGYAQLRLYDVERFPPLGKGGQGGFMRLKRVARWTPMGGQVVRWGHCMTAADIDGDGHDELVTLINFRHEGKQKADLRAFDHRFILKQRCEELTDETLFATCMSAGDIDGDGRTEVVVAGGIFAEVWQGATNQLAAFDGNLDLKVRTTWKTFRHSWVWDLQIADIDGDGNHEVITYGGTSMRGRNQEDANIMGEIRVWEGDGFAATKDMFIWQSKPGEDTRPSRGFAFKDDGYTRFVTATSRWSRWNRAPELEVRTLNYEPVHGAMARYSALTKAYEERDIEALGVFTALEDTALTPISLEALAICGGKAAKAVGGVLGTRNQPLFLRAVELLRHMGTEAVDELRGVGFALPDDWVIISPFDNANNGGFDTQYPPEAEVDLNAFYAGKDKIVRWGKIDDHRQDVYIDLGYTHFESFERTGVEFNWNTLRTESVAYALTRICSPAAMEAQVRVGGTDGVKVWVGDELKHSTNAPREAVPDQDDIPISLVEGKNRILLKIANHETDAWGFYFRVTGAEGEPIPGLRYERPEVSHAHNRMLSCAQLASLLEAQDEHLRCLAGSQLASSGDKRGNEALADLLHAEDASVRAKAALTLTLVGDSRGPDPLARFAPKQDHLFQIAAGYALKRAGDARAEQLSIDNLRDDTGKNVMELKVTNRENGFYVSPMFKGHETSHVDVVTNRQFHLGDNISARYATIGSFGIREPRYRGMGLGGVAIKRACDIIAEMGYLCSTVGTGTRLVAHRLYCRNGYVDRRFPWEYTKQLVGGASLLVPTAEKDGRIKARDYTNADKADVSKLREQYNLNTIGPADWSPRSNFGPWIKVAEDEGEIIGYAYVYLNPFEPVANANLFIDINYPDEPTKVLRGKVGVWRSQRATAARVLLSSVQRYALAEGKETISFHDPPMRYRDILLGMGYRVEPNCIRYRWVNMFKVIDLTGLLREIAGLLSLRLQRSAHAGWRGSIGIKGTRLKSTLIVGSDGEVNAEDDAAENADILITTDDGRITSLVSGDEDIWESYRQHTLTISPMFNERLRGLIQSLFPIMPHKQGGWW
jgi:hypothetical protein